MKTFPEDGLIIPVSILIVVVLPAPFGPKNPKNSPLATLKEYYLQHTNLYNTYLTTELQLRSLSFFPSI